MRKLLHSLTQELASVFDAVTFCKFSQSLEPARLGIKHWYLFEIRMLKCSWDACKFQNDWKSLIANPVSSRLTISLLRFIETAPWWSSIACCYHLCNRAKQIHTGDNYNCFVFGVICNAHWAHLTCEKFLPMFQCHWQSLAGLIVRTMNGGFERVWWLKNRIY